MALENHSSWIRDAKIAPNGGIVATCNHNGFVRLWNITKPPNRSDDGLLAAFSGHAGRIWGLDWSPDGKLLATGGADRIVKLWNVADYVEKSPYEVLDGWVQNVAFTADSATLIAGSRGVPSVLGTSICTRSSVLTCEPIKENRQVWQSLATANMRHRHRAIAPPFVFSTWHLAMSCLMMADTRTELKHSTFRTTVRS